MPLREIRVTLNGSHSELALLDEGSDIVVIRQDIWQKTNTPINQHVRMHMQTANGGSQEMAGCLEMLEIDVEGIKTWAHAYVVPEAPYRFLLGRPWQRLVRLSKAEDTDSVHVSVHDPQDPNNARTVKTTPRPWAHPSLALTASVFSPIIPFPPSIPTSSTDIYHAIKSFGDVIAGFPTQHIRENKIERPNDQYCANLGMKINAKLEGVNSLPNLQQVLAILPTNSTDIYHPILPTSSTNIYHAIPPIISSTTSSYYLSTTRLIMPIPTSRLVFSSFTEFLLQSHFNIDPVHRTFAYKKVANKVKPVATTMPAHAQIIRRFPEDPLASLPSLSPTPPAFIPGTHLTQERMDKLGVFKNEFLLPEERKLAAHVLMNNKFARAWDESEKGRFRDDYFPRCNSYYRTHSLGPPSTSHLPWH
jgi:hypothetical protein